MRLYVCTTPCEKTASASLRFVPLCARLSLSFSLIVCTRLSAAVSAAPRFHSLTLPLYSHALPLASRPPFLLPLQCRRWPLQWLLSLLVMWALVRCLPSTAVAEVEAPPGEAETCPRSSSQSSRSPSVRTSSKSPLTPQPPPYPNLPPQQIPSPPPTARSLLSLRSHRMMECADPAYLWLMFCGVGCCVRVRICRLICRVRRLM